MKATTAHEKRTLKGPKVDPSLSQTAANAAKEEKKDTQPAAPETTTAPVTPAPAAPVTDEKKEQPKKESKPSISATARKLIWQNQKASVEQITEMLVQAGFADAGNRKATVATLRTDALSIISIGRDLGLLKE